MTGDLPMTGNPPAGLFWGFILGMISLNWYNIFINLLPILFTIVVFFMVIYAQGISVDLPLTFSAVRGFGRRWSLKLFYTSNIPVILTAALLANFQLFGGMLATPSVDDPNTRCSILGCSVHTQGGGTQPVSGVMYYLSAPDNLIFDVITGAATSQLYLRALTYMAFMLSCCVIFSVFGLALLGWMLRVWQTS